MDEFNKMIGVWLIQEGNTKTKLAAALGISTQTLSNRLSGRCEWTWNEACLLSDIIGCPLSAFKGQRR